jgi:hypothetical protein
MEPEELRRIKKKEEKEYVEGTTVSHSRNPIIPPTLVFLNKKTDGF